MSLNSNLLVASARCSSTSSRLARFPISQNEFFQPVDVIFFEKEESEICGRPAEFGWISFDENLEFPSRAITCAAITELKRGWQSRNVVITENKLYLTSVTDRLPNDNDRFQFLTFDSNVDGQHEISINTSDSDAITLAEAAEGEEGSEEGRGRAVRRPASVLTETVKTVSSVDRNAFGRSDCFNRNAFGRLAVNTEKL
ncbi:hypothetical protein V9T40_007901 [Parthenolecanium corni]|uniref:Uncharacterized protein n=1 Tax=Parthenolecanium corni TaxID=536013 RepID=A0AAN9Y935_9HEMI